MCSFDSVDVGLMGMRMDISLRTDFSVGSYSQSIVDKIGTAPFIFAGNLRISLLRLL